MGSNRFPTKDAEAYSRFVQGRALFQSYLGTGLGEHLLMAREQFMAAATRDPEFDIANLYLAAADTELRDPDDAIPILNRLVERKSYVTQALVQLAYAHIKRYRDSDFSVADEYLGKAGDAARAHEHQLLDLVKAYRIFLLGVRAAFGHDSPDRKRQYLDEAISAGNQLLQKAAASTTEEQRSVQFEVENALGIAYSYLGQLFPADPNANLAWTNAEQHFKTALALRPRSVRALQNMGQLRLFQGDRERVGSSEASAKYEQAKSLVQQSIELNPFDQYPHFQMAVLAARTGDWQNGEEAIARGKKERGAVSQAKWQAVEEAISAKDSSKARSIH